MRMTIRSFFAISAAALALCAACTDSPPEGTGGAGPAGPGTGPTSSSTGTGTGGNGGAGGADCFTNPQTHVEIINACTDAEKIDKHPDLPLLNPDGSLPPLP